MATRDPIRLILSLPGLRTALRFLAARRIVVRGRSMLPALAPGECVLFDRLAYRRRAPRRGDVVLARQPGTGLLVVKRVAGAPGESVSLDGRERTLAADEFLLLGDDPEVSRDSRDWGPVGREAILARAWLVYWPPARMRVLRPQAPPGRGKGEEGGGEG